MEKVKLSALFFVFFLVFNSCNMEDKNKTISMYKEEIHKTEQAFAKMVKEKGMKEAFLAFAADDAVLSRNNILVKGKDAIRSYFEKGTLQDIKLEWAPDFIDVSVSGDLGYTYGKYKFSAKDGNGKLIESRGIFHTVWKRQKDGKWRFVWD